MPNYVCKGAKLKCSFGSEQSNLNVIHPVNPVKLHNELMANIQDYKPFMNIKPFGQCKSILNPTVASATAANYGVLHPMPCIPNITAPWMAGKLNYSVKGQPALMNNGKCLCVYGGVIEITDDGQKTSAGIQKTGDGAKGIEKEELKLPAKCFIQFRPHSAYDGEFGFDWMRMGDTKQKGDNWFGNIMGRYYENDDVSFFQNSNSWNDGHFKKDLSMYDKKLRSYGNFLCTWKRYKDNAYLYLIPTLTLLEGKTAKFDLKMEIEETPQELTLEFKDKEASKYLTLNKNKITDIKKGKYDLPDEITITCNKEFDTVQVLEIKADGKKMRCYENSS